MDSDLIPASKDDEPILADLLELYSDELRDIANLTPDADGRFGYPPLPLYWTDPDREPFLFRVGGELAGFVLVRKGSVVTGAADVWDVAEFFVLRPYRRQGVGERAAHEVWRRHRGPWEVRVLERNAAALRFWQRTVDAFVGAHVEPVFADLAGKRWLVFAFVSALL